MTDESPRPTVSQILPRQPIDRIVGPLARFMHVETAGGIVLVVATIAALILANSPLADAYLAFWKTQIDLTVGDFEFSHSLKHLINDGCMVVFFFVIGLEVKREIVLGELKDFRVAVLPITAALGGMVVPALLYLSLASADARRGWGIPMATDIAFVVGCMVLLGPRIPASLRVMLLSLAIADDIGAILVIAIGYSHGFHPAWLAVGGAGIAAVSI
ncbi:MAG: Na+/H+ antiporter NhaA, partial [Planctomycetaceae bacterium]